MNQNSGFRYSADDLSDSEKLKELTAYVQGCARMLAIGTKRLVSYHEFLQDEVEANSRAEDFLNRCQVLVGQLGSVSASLRSEETVGTNGEQTGLQLLLNSVIHRCRDKHAHENRSYDLLCPPDLTVFGDIPQLQQMIYGMLEALGDVAAIEIDAKEESYTEKQLRAMGSDCNEGDYVCIDMLSGEAAQLAEVPQVEFRSVCDLLTACVPLRLPLSELMGWLGVLWYHDGELMIGETATGSLCFRLLLGKGVHGTGENAEKLTGGTETILVVDDEGLIWDLVIDLLSNLGYTVLLAANGREAVESYKANPGGIDLVIMDMVMPEMNGREAFECLKRLDPNVKVLMSSGYVSDDDAHYVMEAGAVGFLRKPYKMADLAKMVRALLDK